MKKIKLTKGKFALVDDADFEALSAYKWSAMQCGKNTPLWYAVRFVYIPRKDGKKGTKLVLMHGQLLGRKGVDHINNDSLDNRRENLRVATHSQNAQNSRKRKGTTSKYIGVSWETSRGKWRSMIGVSRKRISIGYFDSERAAAEAYDEAARAHYGPHAQTNF